MTRLGPSPGFELGLLGTHHVDYTSLAQVPETGIVDECVQRRLAAIPATTATQFDLLCGTILEPPTVTNILLCEPSFGVGS